MRIKKRLIAGVMLAVGLFSGYLWMQKPKVSVVMLTYQREKILPQAIDSVLAQTYKNFEFIIINDGSTDNTDDIVKSYKDKRIRYYKNDKNQGIAYSRNKAADLARGEYVMIMDDDDKSLPERMERQVAFLDENENITAVAGQIRGLPRIPDNHDNIAAGLIQYNNFGNANIMYRREFAKTHNIRYDENLRVSEDWDFWVNMLFSGAKFAAIKDDILERNGVSEKHYGISYEAGNVAVREKIGQRFSPQDPQKFYQASACEKIKLLGDKNIFTASFYENLLKINCP